MEGGRALTQSVAHLGTIEELVVSSIASSFGANDTLASFKMIIPKYDYVVDLKKEHTRLKMGEIFTFALKGKDGFWQAFAFDEKRLTVGSDWEVKLAGREAPVALIDQKLLNIGSKFVIHFFDKELYKNLTFYRVVLLFAMMLRFKDDLFAKIEKMKDLIKKGKLKIDVGQSEERLFYNPRILRK